MGIRVRKNKMAPYGTYGGTVSRKWLPWYVVLLLWMIFSGWPHPTIPISCHCERAKPAWQSL